MKNSTLILIVLGFLWFISILVGFVLSSQSEMEFNTQAFKCRLNNGIMSPIEKNGSYTKYNCVTLKCGEL